MDTQVSAAVAARTPGTALTLTLGGMAVGAVCQAASKCTLNRVVPPERVGRRADGRSQVGLRHRGGACAERFWRRRSLGLPAGNGAAAPAVHEGCSAGPPMQRCTPVSDRMRMNFVAPPVRLALTSSPATYTHTHEQGGVRALLLEGLRRQLHHLGHDTHAHKTTKKKPGGASTLSVAHAAIGMGVQEGVLPGCAAT